jgi:siroheme synthase
VREGAAPSSWLAAALAADTVAIYMGAGDAPAIAQALMAAGKPAGTPVALIEDASLEDSRTLAGVLAELPVLAEQLNGGAAMILLGEVLRPALAVAEPRTTRRSLAR